MTEGGKPGRCGWLEERFHFVWRAVPEELPAILNGPDPEGRKQITDTMMAMSRIDLAAMQTAYEGARAKGPTMTYIDGFVVPVPNERRNQYKEHAEKAGAVFREYGMLSMTEAWGDDVPDGKFTSFPKAVKREEGETVVFSWCVWPDKETRDAAWQKIMDDPRMQSDQNPMPFDGKRMIYGGFTPLVEI